MAKFSCIHNGAIVEFTSPYDIDCMRKHPEYKEVLEVEKQAKPAPTESKVETVVTVEEVEATPVKRGRGRPKKVVATA